ncbi:hypothetical protein DL240_09505 [Lujinxingia litoralis]|uniref:Nitrogen fixation protein FixH n=1 Tax=Lujinxingia litoralis TaxID=2211119 RepID=A0A328C8E3_9DELT|nr:FixH family protein [Lujinxingia litoralis]RAL23108.1 hypothetical protein DL240_09505 [Lujinxingia litoralis]
MPSIPSHIFWPGFIIVILAIAMGSGMSIIFASASDGGPRIVPDYYAKAVDWDETQATRRAADELSWTVALRLDEGLAEVAVRDAQNQPLALTGTAQFRLASQIEPDAPLELTAHPTLQGHYRIEGAPDAPGVYDVELVLQAGETPYRRTHRVERSP